MQVQKRTMQVNKYFKSEGKLEIGCLVFAVFNLVTTLIASLASTAGLIIVFKTTSAWDGWRTDLVTRILFGAAVLSTAFFFMSFIYAVILINGLHRRNAQMLNAYFTYGIVVTVHLVSAALAVPLMVGEDFRLIPCDIRYVAYVIWFIYSLILVMIRMTYKKFESSAGQCHHEVFVDNKY